MHTATARLGVEMEEVAEAARRTELETRRAEGEHKRAETMVKSLEVGLRAGARCKSFTAVLDPRHVLALETLKRDDLLSSLGFKFNLRRYIEASTSEQKRVWQKRIAGRGLHSSTFQLNLSRFDHTSPPPPI
jgi:hypothetical protein